MRAGDRIRWTRNDAGLGLVNSRTAEVLRIANGRVTFRLEDGKTLELGKGDPQLRHLDHAWASTVHAFQGRTVDGVIAAMEARHPHLTTQKSFYVEISRARDRAELVTDDAAELQAPSFRRSPASGSRRSKASARRVGRRRRRPPGRCRPANGSPGAMPAKHTSKDRGGPAPPAKERDMPAPERDRGRGMDLGL